MTLHCRICHHFGTMASSSTWSPCSISIHIHDLNYEIQKNIQTEAVANLCSKILHQLTAFLHEFNTYLQLLLSLQNWFGLPNSDRFTTYSASFFASQFQRRNEAYSRNPNTAGSIGKKYKKSKNDVYNEKLSYYRLYCSNRKIKAHFKQCLLWVFQIILESFLNDFAFNNAFLFFSRIKISSSLLFFLFKNEKSLCHINNQNLNFLRAFSITA